MVESDKPATFAWKKPSRGAYRKSSPAMRQHYDMGGLGIFALASSSDIGESLK